MLPLAQVRGVVELLRPANTVAAVPAMVLGYVVAGGSGWVAVVSAAIIVALAHSAATLQNDIADAPVDRANGRSGPLLTGSFSAAAARQLVYGLYGAALLLALAAPGRWAHVGFLAAYIVLAWAYNLPPLRLSYRPIASITVMGLCYGVVPLVYGYALGGGAPATGFWWLVAVWWVQRTSLSMLKDFKDALGDKQFSKHTFFLTYGQTITVRLSLAGAIVGYIGVLLWLVINRHFVTWPGWVLLGVLLLWGVWGMVSRTRLLSATSRLHLNRVFHRCFYGHNQFEGILAICCIFSVRSL